MWLICYDLIKYSGCVGLWVDSTIKAGSSSPKDPKLFRQETTFPKWSDTWDSP